MTATVLPTLCFDCEECELVRVLHELCCSQEPSALIFHKSDRSAVVLANLGRCVRFPEIVLKLVLLKIVLAIVPVERFVGLLVVHFAAAARVG